MKVLNYTGLQNLWTNIKNYITVHTPTKTSDLTNDSGFLTSTDISSKANDSEVLHKAQNETVTGEKTFKKDVKIIDLNANERPGVKFEVNGTFRTFEDAKDALPTVDDGDFGVIGVDTGLGVEDLNSVWSGFVLNDNIKLQNSMSDYVINDITFGSTNDSSVIEFNNYYKVKYNDDSGMQTDLRGMLRFELSPYANVEKGDQLWSNPNLYFYAMFDGESGNTILGHENAYWSKAYINEINCYEIKFGGNSIRDILENIVSLSYVTHYSSTALTNNSTNSLSVIDNQDSVKVNDKVIDSTGKMFYITSVDHRNGEFEVGSVVDTFAKDSAVVHNSGNETVSGVKTFSDDTFVKSLNFTNEVANSSSSSSSILPIIATVTYTDQSASQSARLNLRITADGSKSFYPHENLAYSLGLSSRMWSDFYTYHGYFRGQQQNDEYSGNARTNLTLLANRDTLGQSGLLIDTFRENTTQGTGMHILGFGMKENSVRYEGCRLQWQYDSTNLGYNFNLKPNNQGTNVPLTYNLGTSSDRWNSVYSLNYYYGSNNTEFSDKFVTADTSQTITGAKTWANAQVWSVNCQRRITTAIEKGEVPSSAQARNDYYTLKNGTTTYGGALGIFGCTLSDSNVVSTYFHAIKNVANSTTRTTFLVKYYTNTDEKTVETNGDIIPAGSSQNLGNSTSKWKTFNGLSPSSLSLPDLDNGVDISSYVDVTQTSQYTAPANGYISICGYASSANAILIKDHDYDYTMSSRSLTTNLGATTYLTVPVIKNHVYDITCSAVTAIDYAKFFPCLGNV